MPKKSSLILFMVCGIIQISISQSIVVKPYLQNASSTQISIMWEAGSAGNGTVVLGDSPFNLDVTIASVSVSGNGSSRIHTAIADDLNPQSKYYYKVVMADFTESFVYNFVTPSLVTSDTKVQLVAMSDMQRDGSHPNKFKEIVEDGIIHFMTVTEGKNVTDLDAVLIPGDLVPTGGNYDHWKNFFFNQGDSLFSHVPFYPVLGNHEYFGSGGQQTFLKYFDLPMNGPAGMEERTWYKDISNLRIVGFDSNANGVDQDSQLAWLDNLLVNTCSEEHIDFVFAELHHPHLSELWTPGESNFTGEIIDRLEVFSTECNKASIHFFGHTHGYSRGQSRDDQHLWVNVATAGGAIDNWGEFPNADYDEFVKSQDEYGFVLVESQAGLDPHFTLKRYGRGDQDVIQNNVLRDEIVIRNLEDGPIIPYPIYPVNLSVGANCVTLQASQFSDSEDIHQSSHWQIANENDFVNNVITESWKQSENWYFEIDTQADDDLSNEKFSGLNSGIELFWRVRYRDEYLKWSDWSIPTNFSIQSVDTISINLLVNGDAESDTSGWTGDIESLENAECNSVASFEGDSNFGVGGVCANESNTGIAYQDIDLSTYATNIDSDLLSVAYNGFMRNFNGSDIPEAYLEFYDQNEALISTTNSISNVTATWTNKFALEELPINSRICRLVLKGTRLAGSDNDSYFDALGLYIVRRTECNLCIGSGNMDQDDDGYCEDIDCDDSEVSVYPGAIEICDLLDNDCDGMADLGDTIRWTGLGSSEVWSDGANWDQLFPPLPCQHVIVDMNAISNVDRSYACKGITVKASNTLIINEQSTLLVNGDDTGSNPNVTVDGSFINDGKCVIKNASQQSVVIMGTFTNNGVLHVTDSVGDNMLIKDGGLYLDKGETNFRE